MLKKTTKMEIGEVVEQRSERAKSANFPVLSVSNSQGFIRQEEQFLNRKVASENTENYKVVFKNDYAYNPARINVGSLARLKNEDRGIVSPMYVVFSTKKMINNDYLDYYFQSENFKKQMRILLSGSVRQTLDFSALSNIIINLPNEAEQAKIGAFLSAIDRLIEMHKEKVDRIKSLKKCYLQKMFPVDGDNKPRSRFQGFSGVWEELRLGNLGQVAMNKRIFKDQTTDFGDVPFFKIGTFGGKPDAFIKRDLFDEYKKKFPFPKVGDLLISASGSIGRIVEYKGEDQYFQDSNIVWLDHNDKVLNKFLKHFYSVVKWKGLEGSTIQRLYNKNILETRIKLPNIKEQEKIGSFLSAIDRLIEKEEVTIEHYESLKKGYLQRIFAD